MKSSTSICSDHPSNLNFRFVQNPHRTSLYSDPFERTVHNESGDATNHLEVRTVQASQSVALRLISSAPWCVTNKTPHDYFNIDKLAKSRCNRFHSKLRHHPNPRVSRLTSRTLRDNPLHAASRGTGAANHSINTNKTKPTGGTIAG